MWQSQTYQNKKAIVDNQIFLQNTKLFLRVLKEENTGYLHIRKANIPDISCNYTLYKNAGFSLVNSRDIFLQIQALIGICRIFTSCRCICIRLTFFHGICKIVFDVFTLHRDACNKICKILSVVRFM
jgi:hypothetical protein